MARITQGWAYVSGSKYVAEGGAGAIQFANDALLLSGSTLLTTDQSGSLTGSLISASYFYGDGSGLTGITASATQVADGPEMAIQFRFDSPIGREISGSSNLMWHTGSTDYLQVTGAVRVAGALTASTVTTSDLIGGSPLVISASTITLTALTSSLSGNVVISASTNTDIFRVESSEHQKAILLDSNGGDAFLKLNADNGPITTTLGTYGAGEGIKLNDTGVLINCDANQNCDFRVETKDHQYALFVDAGTNHVVFFSGSGGGNVDVSGALEVSADYGYGLNITGSASGSLLDITSDAVGSATESILFVSGSGEIGMGTLVPNHTLTISGSVSASADVTASAFYFGPGGRQQITDTSTDFSLLATSTPMAIGADGGNVVVQGAHHFAPGNLSSSVPVSASAFYGSSLKYVEKLTLSSSANVGIDADGGSVAFADGGAPKLFLYMNNSAAPAIFDSVGGNIGFSPNSAGGGGFVGVTGSLSASINISASAFYGDGSNLLQVSSDTVDTTSDSSNTTFYLPFVSQSTGQNGETLYIHDTLQLLPGSGSLTVSGNAGVDEYMGLKGGIFQVTHSYGGKLSLGGFGSPYLQTQHFYATSSLAEMEIGPFNKLQIYQDGQISLSSSANAVGQAEAPAGIELVCNPGNGLVSVETNRVAFYHNTASLSSDEQEYLWSINSDHTGGEDDSAWIKLDMDSKEFAVGSADSIKLVALGGLQVDNAASTFNSTSIFKANVTASAALKLDANPSMNNPNLWISSSSPAFGPPGSNVFGTMFIGSGSVSPSDGQFTGASLQLHNFGYGTELRLRSRSGHITIQSDGASADTTIKSADGEVILSGSDGVIFHTDASFNGTAAFNSAANFNDTATFNSQINAWGNATFGNAHSDNLTVNSSASFNNMGNIKSTASAITWQVADGIDGLSPGGNNGALMFFTGSGGDLMKFHTSGSAKGVVMASNVYMNFVGNGEEQPANNLAFYVSSSNFGYVTRTTGQQVFNQAVSSSTSTGLTASNGQLSVQIIGTKTGGIAKSGSTADPDASGIFLSGSDLPGGAFDHGSWYNSTIIFSDVNDTAHDGMKKITMADVATKLAGANITATNGVLAAAGGGGGGGGGGIFTEINATQAASTSSVAIGQAGAPNGILEVSGSQETSGTPLFRVTGDSPDSVTAAGPPPPIFFVTGSGRVGIGTSTPSRLLELSGSDSVTMKFTSQLRRAYTMGSNGYGFMIFDDSTGGTPGYRFIISDTAGRLGYTGIGSGLTSPLAQLHVSSSGDISNYGVLRVDGDAHTNILFVTGSNRVGIGTDIPAASLHISGTTADAKLLVASDSKAIELFPASGPAMGFGTPADTDYYMKFGAFGGLNQIWLNDGTTDFQISGSVGGVGYYLDQSEQAVGIGTQAPAASLHVSSSAPGIGLEGDLFCVSGETNGSIFFVSGSGDVGIGTTAPGASLEVLGDTLADQLRLGHGGTHYYKMGRGGDGFFHIQGTQEHYTGYTFKDHDGNTVVNILPEASQGPKLAVTGSIMPGTDNTHDLGSSAMRWANVYTGDLHLANDRGNWTVVEESDYLTIRNNKTGKRFKLLMEEID